MTNRNLGKSPAKWKKKLPVVVRKIATLPKKWKYGKTEKRKTLQ